MGLFSLQMIPRQVQEHRQELRLSRECAVCQQQIRAAAVGGGDDPEVVFDTLGFCPMCFTPISPCVPSRVERVRRRWRRWQARQR